MSGLVEALLLAPIPDLDVAGLVKDLRRLARHRRRAGAGPKTFNRNSGRHFSFGALEQLDPVGRQLGRGLSLPSKLTMPAMSCMSLLLLRAGTHNNLTTAIGSLGLRQRSGSAPLPYAWPGHDTLVLRTIQLIQPGAPY